MGRHINRPGPVQPEQCDQPGAVASRIESGRSRCAGANGAGKRSDQHAEHSYRTDPDLGQGWAGPKVFRRRPGPSRPASVPRRFSSARHRYRPGHALARLDPLGDRDVRQRRRAGPKRRPTQGDLHRYGVSDRHPIGSGSARAVSAPGTAYGVGNLSRSHLAGRRVRPDQVRSTVR